MSSLSGNTVVVVGGTSGIGLETARQAHAAGAKLIITGRNQGRLDAARDELGASARTLPVNDAAALQRFFAELPAPVDHVVVTGGGPVRLWWRRDRLRPPGPGTGPGRAGTRRPPPPTRLAPPRA